MATRKIHFQRFKEGDPFSTGDMDNRFAQFEKDLNLANDGLESGAIGEGALNYQHLSSPGLPTTTDYNFGSTLVNVASLRNDPSRHPNGWQRYNAAVVPDLYTNGHIGDGWSLHNGRVIGEGLFTSSSEFSPKKMEITINDVKMGSNYYTTNDPGYSSGILLMFNTYVLSEATPDGFGIELQVKCNTGASTVNEWVPIRGCSRWVWSHVGDGVSPAAAQPVCIRAFLTRQRILDSFGSFNNPDMTSANMIVKGFRAKIGVIGNSGTSGDTDIYLKESTLSSLALRVKEAV